MQYSESQTYKPYFPGCCWSQTFCRRAGPLPIQLYNPRALKSLPPWKKGSCARDPCCHLSPSLDLNKVASSLWLPWPASSKTQDTFSCFHSRCSQLRNHCSPLNSAVCPGWTDSPKNSIRGYIWSITNLYWKWPNSVFANDLRIRQIWARFYRNGQRPAWCQISSTFSKAQRNYNTTKGRS